MSGMHTPGPWEWRTDQLEPFRTQWSLSPGILIAEGYDGTPGGDEHDRANARLIAAAPELLDELTDLSASLPEWADPESVGSDEACEISLTWDQVHAIRAAIAKATGQ